MVALGAMIFTACSDDDDKDKDFPKEDPTDPNIVRTITLTIDVNNYEAGFTFDNKYWFDKQDEDSPLISSIGRIAFPTDLSIDWGDGSITHSSSHKYETRKGIYNVIISAKNLRWFETYDGEVTAIDLKKCNSLVGLSLCNQYNIYEIDIVGFTELKYLELNSTELKSLNIDGCDKLIYCDCHYNDFETFNIDDCKNLKFLNLSDNNLKELSIPKGSQLESLDLSSNEITTIDLSNCSLLQELDLGYNELTSLDISKNTKLTELNCSGNELTSLDVSKNTELKELWCGSNNLTSLDVSKNTALTTLWCDYNNLTSLDISKNTKGVLYCMLYCRYNKLTAEALNKIFTDLPVISGTILIYNNPGTNTCDKSIAEKKGWYVNDWHEN